MGRGARSSYLSAPPAAPIGEDRADVSEEAIEKLTSPTAPESEDGKTRSPRASNDEDQEFTARGHMLDDLSELISDCSDDEVVQDLVKRASGSKADPANSTIISAAPAPSKAPGEKSPTPDQQSPADTFALPNPYAMPNVNPGKAVQSTSNGAKAGGAKKAGNGAKGVVRGTMSAATRFPDELLRTSGTSPKSPPKSPPKAPKQAPQSDADGDVSTPSPMGPDFGTREP